VVPIIEHLVVNPLEYDQHRTSRRDSKEKREGIGQFVRHYAGNDRQSFAMRFTGMPRRFEFVPAWARPPSRCALQWA
jgi:hypothetical protein